MTLAWPTIQNKTNNIIFRRNLTNAYFVPNHFQPLEIWKATCMCILELGHLNVMFVRGDSVNRPTLRTTCSCTQVRRTDWQAAAYLIIKDLPVPCWQSTCSTTIQRLRLRRAKNYKDLWVQKNFRMKVFLSCSWV